MKRSMSVGKWLLVLMVEDTCGQNQKRLLPHAIRCCRVLCCEIREQEYAASFVAATDKSYILF